MSAKQDRKDSKLHDYSIDKEVKAMLSGYNGTNLKPIVSPAQREEVGGGVVAPSLGKLNGNQVKLNYLK